MPTAQDIIDSFDIKDFSQLQTDLRIAINLIRNEILRETAGKRLDTIWLGYQNATEYLASTQESDPINEKYATAIRHKCFSELNLICMAFILEKMNLFQNKIKMNDPTLPEANEYLRKNAITFYLPLDFDLTEAAKKHGAETVFPDTTAVTDLFSNLVTQARELVSTGVDAAAYYAGIAAQTAKTTANTVGEVCEDMARKKILSLLFPPRNTTPKLIKKRSSVSATNPQIHGSEKPNGDTLTLPNH